MRRLKKESSRRLKIALTNNRIQESRMGSLSLNTLRTRKRSYWLYWKRSRNPITRNISSLRETIRLLHLHTTAKSQNPTNHTHLLHPRRTTFSCQCFYHSSKATTWLKSSNDFLCSSTCKETKSPKTSQLSIVWRIWKNILRWNSWKKSTE